MDPRGRQCLLAASPPSASAACKFGTSGSKQIHMFRQQSGNHFKTAAKGCWRQSPAHQRIALLVPELSPTAARISFSVAGPACDRENHCMITSALLGGFSPPPQSLARGGRWHLPDVAVEPMDVAAVTVLPSLATALLLSLWSASS